jgi:hypothetical protein
MMRRDDFRETVLGSHPMLVTYIATVDGELVDPYLGQVLMRLDHSIRDPCSRPFPTTRSRVAPVVCTSIDTSVPIGIGPVGVGDGVLRGSDGPQRRQGARQTPLIGGLRG